MTQPPPSVADFEVPQTDNVHLLEYWRIIRLRLRLFILIVVVVVAGALFYCQTAEPQYRGTCQMLIEPVQTRVTDIETVYDPTNMSGALAKGNFLDTQQELISSDRVLAKVFHQFNFAEHEAFINSLEPLKSFRNHVTVEQERNTFLVSVHFDWGEPELAAEVANYIAEVYMQDYRARMLGYSSRGLEALRAKLLDMREARRDALDALNDFKQKHGVIDLDDAYDLLVSRLSTMNESLIEAKVDAITARAGARTVEQWMENPDTDLYLPEVFDNPAVTSFKLEKLKAEARMLELQGQYGKGHPKIETQRIVAETFGEAVTDEIRNSMRSVLVSHRRASLLKDLLRESYEETQQEAFRLDELAGEFRILKDAYTTAEKSYRQVLSRINEIEITKSTAKFDSGSGTIMIINRAQAAPTPVAPNKTKIMALALILGLGLGAGTCFGLDYLNTTVKDKEDVEGSLGAPVLGSIPRLTGSEVEFAQAPTSHDQFSEAFRTIRTSVGLSLTGRNQQAFLCTSSSPSEGKTLSSFMLALTFAREGRTVLLLEFDMRRPRLRKLFGDKAPASDDNGLSKVLVNAESLENVVWSHPTFDSLHIAFCGPVPPNPAELLNSERCDAVLQEAQQKYDIVVMDSPPVLNVADPSILAAKGIPVVFVTSLFKTDRHAARSAAEQLAKVQGRVIGAVMNSDKAPKRYGGYGYYYSRHGYRYGSGRGAGYGSSEESSREQS